MGPLPLHERMAIPYRTTHACLCATTNLPKERRMLTAFLETLGALAILASIVVKVNAFRTVAREDAKDERVARPHERESQTRKRLRRRD